jgi:hypothetical protein
MKGDCNNNSIDNFSEIDKFNQTKKNSNNVIGVKNKKISLKVTKDFI